MANFVDIFEGEENSTRDKSKGFVDIFAGESTRTKLGEPSSFAEGLVGGVDYAASMAHQATMFPFHLGAEAMGYTAGALLPGFSGKELAEKYGKAVESVTLQPGMIEEAITGKQGMGRKLGELTGEAFEFFIPTRQMQENLSKMKELGVPEGVADQTAFWWSRFTELLAFKGIGELASGAKAEIAKLSERKIRNAVESSDPSKAVDIAQDLYKDLNENIEGLRTPEGRQAFINRQFAEEIRQKKIDESGLEYPETHTGFVEDTSGRTPEARAKDKFIQLQRKYTAGELLKNNRSIEDIMTEKAKGTKGITIPDKRIPIVKYQQEKWGTKTSKAELPKEPKAEEPVQLIRRGTEETQRTNAEARSHMERQRGLQRSLDQARRATQQVKPVEQAPKIEPPAKNWKEHKQTEDKLIDKIEAWLRGERKSPPQPDKLYRGIQDKKQENFVNGDYTHVTPWAFQAARGGKGAFGDTGHRVLEYTATPDTLYYRGGALAGDPLETTKILNAQGMTWNELLNETKKLYIKQKKKFLKEEATEKEAVEYAARSAVKNLRSASFEADLSNKAGIWRGREVPKELSKETPRLRSIDDLKAIVQNALSGGMSKKEVAQLPEYKILKANGKRLPETTEQKVAAAQKDIEAEIKLNEPPPQREKPVVREAIKEIEGGISEVPKGEEPASYIAISPKEFKNEQLSVDSKGKDATHYLLNEDGTYEYSIFGKKDFGTVAEAEKYLKNKRWQKTREELKKSGVDLEVIKVGDKYRIGEPLRSELPEFKAGVEEGAKAVETDLEARRETPKLTEDEAKQELYSLMKDIEEFKAGNDVDIGVVEDTVRRIGADFRDGPIADGVDLMLTEISKVKNVKTPNEQGLWIGRHPTKRGLEIVYKGEEEFFESPMEALDFMDERGINGVVEPAPNSGDLGDRWVIELKEPKPLPFDETKYTPPKSVDDVSEVVRTFRDIMDDIIESIKGPLEGERGSISFKDMAPEKVEALRRLAEDARRAGVSVRDYLLKLKYPLDVADKTQKVIDAIAKQVPLDRPVDSDFNLQTGGVANTGRLERITSSGEVVRRPKIFVGEVKEIMQGKDIKDTGMFKEFVPTIFAAKKSGSRFFKNLNNWALQAESVTKLKSKADRAEIRAQFKDFKARTGASPSDLTKFLYARQAGGLERLSKNMAKNFWGKLKEAGIKPEEIKDFTGDPIVKWIDQKMEAAFDEINSVRKNANKDPIPQVPDYFTFMMSELAAERAGIEANRFIDPPAAIKNRYRAFTEDPFRYLKPRTKFGKAGVLELDASRVLRRYLEGQTRYVNYTPIIAKVAELSKPLKTGEVRTTKTGKTVDKLFYMPKQKPNLYNTLTRWSNYLAGFDKSAFGAGVEGTKFTRGINTLRRNLTMSMLGGNLRTGAIQITALRNTASMVGITKTAQGVIDLLSPTLVREAHSKSNLLDLRKAELELAEVLSRNTGVIDKTAVLSTKHIQYVDSVTATATWRAAYRRAKANKLSEPKAVEFAEDITSMTQGASTRSQLAPIQRTAIGKALTLFQTFTINDWNLLYSEIIGKGGEKLPVNQRIGRVLRYVAVTTAFNILFEDAMGINSPFPTPIRAAAEALDQNKDVVSAGIDTLKELLEPLPLLGGAVKYGSTPLGPVVSTIGDLFMALNDPFNENKMDNVGHIWEVGGKLLPVPGVAQSAKTKRALERGESLPGALIGTHSRSGKLQGLSGIGGLRGL